MPAQQAGPPGRRTTLSCFVGEGALVRATANAVGLNWKCLAIEEATYDRPGRNVAN